MNIQKIFEDKYNTYFIAILVFAFILRIKYLNFQQPLWWDEAEYLSIAKHWAYGIPFEVSPIRPYLFPFFAAALYKVGLGAEWLFRIMELILSLCGVLLTYVIGRKLFTPMIGLIASFIMSFFYLKLFYTARILVGMPSMVLWMLTIYLFWKGYVVKTSKYHLWLMGFVLGLNYTLRFPSSLVGFALLGYLLMTEGLKFLKNKHLWIALAICVATMMPYFIYFYTAFDKIPVLESGTYGWGKAFQFDFYLGIMPTVLQSKIPFVTQISPLFQILLLLLLFGIGYMLFNLVIGFDIIRKRADLRNCFFLILWMVIPFVFFSLIELAEDRYLFYAYPAMFIAIAFALTKIAYWFKKYHGFLPYIIIGLVLFSGVVTQLKYADFLINAKSDSYIQLKQAGLWIKSNSKEGDVVISTATPQNTYYSERHTVNFPSLEEDFEALLEKEKPKYLMLTLLERSPEWAYSWPERNKDKVRPIQVFFMDPEQTQPGVVIYQFIKGSI